MYRLIKVLFFALIVKPLVLFWLGLNTYSKDSLPTKGPAIIVANHNSHLDTLVLMSLYPLSTIHRIQPVAAADYFLTSRFMAWFSLNIIGIIPIKRRATKLPSSLFQKCHEALAKNHILILFPEGSRGKPEKMSELKRGVYHLIKSQPSINVTPVALHGLGRALPKGERIFVPFNCDIMVGETIHFLDDAKQYTDALSVSLNELLDQCPTKQSEEVNERFDN